jgi:hypothetical protein
MQRSLGSVPIRVFLDGHTAGHQSLCEKHHLPLPRGRGSESALNKITSIQSHDQREWSHLDLSAHLIC